MSLLRAFLSDDQVAFATFTFGKGLDVVVFSGDTVDDAAIGGVEVGDVRAASLLDLFNPAPGLLGKLFGALFLVVGDVEIDSLDAGVVVAKSSGEDVLKRAQGFGISAN